MAVFSGTAILNTGGTGADSPATNPILIAATPLNIVGFAFTNPSNTLITVAVYRNSIAAANLLFTASVPALAGMTGGPAIVTQAVALSLQAGEMIFTPGSLPGVVNVEIDGLAVTTTTAQSTNQMLLAVLLMMQQAFGVDIPDANQLAPLGYNM